MLYFRRRGDSQYPGIVQESLNYAILRSFMLRKAYNPNRQVLQI